MERFIYFERKDLKRCLVLALMLLCFIPASFSQSANALYLKDGNRIIGYVLNVDSVGDVSIQTTDGKRLDIPMADVDRINWSYVIKQDGPGSIYRYADRYRWAFNNEELSDRDYERYFDDDLYHTYITGSNLYNIGGGCWLYSVACMAFCVWAFDPDCGFDQSTSFYAYVAGAGTLGCLGAVFTRMGKKRLNWVERTYNSQNVINETTSSLINSVRLDPSVMLTAQHDLAFGAILSFTF